MPNYSNFDPNSYRSHQKILQMVGKDKKVLEVGCATGYISKRLQENGCTVVGVEIDRESALEARKYCNEVIVGNVEMLIDLGYPEDFFDVVCFGDVLEHLKDPQVVLRNLRRYLRGGGYIVVSVPNIANWAIRFHLLFGRFNYQSGGILDDSHLRFFTLRTIRNLIEDAGFKVVKLDVTPGLEDFFLWKYAVTLPARVIERVFHFRFHDCIAYYIARLYKRLFAQQFLIQAQKVTR